MLANIDLVRDEAPERRGEVLVVVTFDAAKTVGTAATAETS